jgi:hypothetical protein
MLSLAYSQKRTPAISDGRYGEAPNKLEPTAHSGQSLMCIFRAARQVLRSLAIHSGAKSGYRLMMLRLRLLQATLPDRLAVRCSLPRELTFVEASKSWVGGISRWAERRLLVNCFLAPIICEWVLNCFGKYVAATARSASLRSESLYTSTLKTRFDTSEGSHC